MKKEVLNWDRTGDVSEKKKLRRKELLINISGEREDTRFFFFFLMVNLPFRPQPFQGRERGPFNKTPQWRPWQGPRKHCSLKFSKSDCKTLSHVCSCFCPSLCLFGSSYLDRLRPWQNGTARLTEKTVFQSRCPHSCTVCHCCGGWRRARDQWKKHLFIARSTLLQCRGAVEQQSNCLPVAASHPGLAVSLPRNSEHLLFRSVGDLFTYRSRFLLPTNLILQE